MSMMSNKHYSNFVRPSSSGQVNNSLTQPLSGEEARRIYLEEIIEAGHPCSKKVSRRENRTTSLNNASLGHFSKKDLFLSAQNNNIQTLTQILDRCPDMLDATDDFGWSLLMIACQANSVDAVRELLKRGICTSVRDKAGNSAQSLVIKNRNFILADILLNYISSDVQPVQETRQCKDATQNPTTTCKERYYCKLCKKDFSDKNKHLSSTVHNIDASKGKKIPSSYKIPSSNKGYQLMLKVGWDRDSGLGPDGSGKKYPLKTVQKKDRKGLGLDNRKKQDEKNTVVKHVNRKLMDKECTNNRSMEINFRRQFY